MNLYKEICIVHFSSEHSQDGIMNAKCRFALKRKRVDTWILYDITL